MLKDGSDCLGDNRDTHYLSYFDAEFNDTDIYVVIGSNSVETGKCTYTNLGLYQVTKRPLLNHTKITSTNLTVDDRKMNNSASAYGVADNRVFAYQLSRNCDGIEFCLHVGYTKQEVPASTEWAVAYRPYLDPKTHTGPLLSELIIPFVLKFRK